MEELAAAVVVPAVAPLNAAAAERGIVGHAALELRVGSWAGADGKPTTFSIEASRGRWTFLKCFQYWCPGCHSSGFPTLVKVQEAFGTDGPVAFDGFHADPERLIGFLEEQVA